MSDLIDRQAAIDVAKDVHNAVLCCEVSPSKSLLEVVKRLESLPSAEPKTGEWIDWLGKGNEWECSVCKCSIESHGSIAYKYCPNCGVRMIEEGKA